MHKFQIEKILAKHNEWLEDTAVSLDHVCLPMRYHSIKAQIDDKVAIQLLYYLLQVTKSSRNVSDELKCILLTEELKELANKFHMVAEQGIIFKVEEI